MYEGIVQELIDELVRGSPFRATAPRLAVNTNTDLDLVVACSREAIVMVEGGAAEASFMAQSVLDTFRDNSGAALGAGSVDLINASGAVGCHFDHAASVGLAAEVARVLAPGGLALIDSGPAGTPGDDLRAIFADHGFISLGHARSCVVDRYRQLRLRKPG